MDRGIDRGRVPDGDYRSGDSSNSGRRPGDSRGVDCPPGAEQPEEPFPRSARPLDYLFLLRPMILIPVWTFFLLGARHGSAASGTPAQAADLAAGLVSFTALLGAVYIINQITDREADRANRKLFFISRSIIPPGAARLEAAFLVIMSFTVGIVFLSWRYVLVCALSLLLGAAYSIEPVRLKKRAVLDVLANAIGNGILNTLAGWTAIGAPLAGWRVLLVYPLAVASVHLTTTLADINGDAASGLRTSGVVLGPRPGIIISTGLMAAAAAAALALGNTPALCASLLSVPLFLIPARSPWQDRSPSAVLLPAKAATLIFTIVAGFLFHFYIPAVAVVILATRLYYHKRFGMTYPSL